LIDVQGFSGGRAARSPVRRASVPPANLIELMATVHAGELALARSVLDAEGIAYFVEGEQFALIQHAVPARVLVFVDDEAHARDVLRPLGVSVAR
jgi:hypothetical protein